MKAVAASSELIDRMLIAFLPLCTGHPGNILQLEALAGAAHAGAGPLSSCTSPTSPAAAQDLAYALRHIVSDSMCPLPRRTLTSFADERLRRWHAWSSLAPQAFRKSSLGMRKSLFQSPAGELVSLHSVTVNVPADTMDVMISSCCWLTAAHKRQRNYIRRLVRQWSLYNASDTDWQWEIVIKPPV